MARISTSVGGAAYDSRGSGPAVIFLPSGAHDRRDYDELRFLLPGRFRSISIDWPGHGESPAWSQAAGEPRLTQLLEEIVESLAPEGAVMAGNSIGGNVAARLTIRRPDLVTGLVLIDTGGFEKPQLFARVFCGLMSWPWFVRAIYPAFSKWYTRPRTETDSQARANAIATTRSPPGRRAVSQMWHSFNLPAHDLRGDAGQITAPTLIVCWRRDPILPVSVAQATHNLITGSKLLLVDSGHAPHTTDPAAVAAGLIPMLETALPARSPAHPAQSASLLRKDGQR